MNEQTPPAAFKPRYNPLTVCIRVALYGFDDPGVQHMLARMREMSQRERVAQAVVDMTGAGA